ncbi:mir domain protein [Ichthyophthirius multifiliis]|uniref:Mir domain protein n=1 Tax=Ichthyophthirius multifiliis TaxID=5932 RepID=G0QVU8_ICHMU|nr:mir domain protein [Ichthyophthirius multifiliis]EGR30656.1 mir domain protein [Ichthyophthirius multifiliis]|eukprot:XP_004032243.1 mir domain protein [Ichthyophthirius multifiliis]
MTAIQLLKYLKERTLKERKNNNVSNANIQSLKINSSILDLILFFTNSSEFSQQLYESSKLLIEVVEQETLKLERNQNLTFIQKIYLLDSFIPVVNFYAENYFKVQSYSLKDQLSEQKQKLSQFAYQFLSKITKQVNIDKQNEDLFAQNDERIKNVKVLAVLFDFQLPESFLGDYEQEEFVFQLDFDEEQIANRLKKKHKTLKGQKNIQDLHLLEEDGSSQHKNMNKMKKENNQIIHKARQIEYWKVFKQKVQESQKVKNLIKQEIKTISQSILNVNYIFKMDFGNKNYTQSKKEIILKSDNVLLKFFQFIEFQQQKNIPKKNTVFVLQILISILTHMDLNENDSYMQNQKKKEQQIKEILKERQGQMNKLNGTKIVLKLFWDECENNYEYQYYLIKYLILLIKGPNLIIQNSIYNYFVSSINSEKLFQKINLIFTQYINNQKNNNLEQQKLVIQLLKLLKLFCEGHYLNLQNYLSHQINSKYSYNLVELIVKLLIQTKINENTYKLIIQCFKTVNDFVQGPCIQNQLLVANTKFFEYAVKILNEDKNIYKINKQKYEKKKKLLNILTSVNLFFSIYIYAKKNENNDSNKNKDNLTNLYQEYNNENRFQIQLKNVSIIKYQCLLTILGIIECQNNNIEFIQRIMRIIPIKILTENLIKVYKQYQKYGNNDYNISLFKQIKNQNNQQELIIENGFLIYTLMKIYENNKDIQDDQYENMNLILNEFQIKENQNSIKSILNDNNNILGNMAKLGQDILNVGKSALNVNKIKIYYIYIYLQDIVQQLLGEKYNNQKQNQEDQQELEQAICFFRNKLCQIEIIRDNQLFTIYFPKLPFCFMMKDKFKEEFNNKLDRSSNKQKLKDLIYQADTLIRVIKCEEKIRRIIQKRYTIGFIISNHILWERISFYITIAINIIIIASYSEYYIDNQYEIYTKDSVQYKNALNEARLFYPRLLNREYYKNTKALIYTLGIVNMILFCLVFVIFIFKKSSFIIGNLWKGFFSQQENLTLKNKIIKACVNLFFSIYMLMSDFDVVYYIVQLTCVLLGIFAHPFFFAGLLSDFLRIRALKHVVLAVYQPRVYLFFWLVIFFLGQYYFTIYSYIYFFDHYLDKDCNSMWRCFFKNIDHTFKNAGAIGDIMYEPKSLQILKENISQYRGVNQKLLEEYFSRFIFDNLFYFTFIVFFMSMFAGIIIDQFRQIKNKMNQKVIDQNKQCFICGLNREILDEKIGFYQHIKIEHNMWNYIYFKAYLKYKNQQQFNGNENYIWNKIEMFDLSWIPIRRTSKIKDFESEKYVKNQDTINAKENIYRINL